MKCFYIIFFTLILTSSCATYREPIPLSSIENIALCNFGEETKEIYTKIEKEEGFVKSGKNLYQPVDPIIAFGYEVAFVGLIGVSGVPGPFIVVKGEHKDVIKSIKNNYNEKFECKGDRCISEVDKYWYKRILTHPTDQNLTIIQCGYFGP